MKSMKWLAIAASLFVAPAAWADDASYSPAAYAVVEQTELVDGTMDFMQGMMIGLAPMLLMDVNLLSDDLSAEDFDQDAFKADVETAVGAIDREPVYATLAARIDERFTPAEIDAILNDERSGSAQAWADSAGDELGVAMETSGYQAAMESALDGAAQKAAEEARARKAAE